MAVIFGIMLSFVFFMIGCILIRIIEKSGLSHDTKFLCMIMLLPIFFASNLLKHLWKSLYIYIKQD